jgi:AbiV family abortive infection protein
MGSTDNQPAGDENLSERIGKYLHGAQVIFENAEALYDEAQILGQAGSYARSAVLHQISMEECAKIDLLGASATSILMGFEIDEERIARVFRDHKAKNYTNAYNVATTQEEREARDRGDRKGSIEAFKSFQRLFHNEVNNIKNGGLYVDFREQTFVSPKEVITEAIAVAFMRRNAEFLQRSALFLRLLERMQKDPWRFAEFSREFALRAETLRADKSQDPEIFLSQIMEDMAADYIEQKRQREDS